MASGMSLDDADWKWLRLTWWSYNSVTIK